MTSDKAPSLRRRRHVAWHNPVALARGLCSRPKLYLAIVGAIAAYFLAPEWLPPSARAIVAWNAGAVIYVAGSFYLFSTCNDEAAIRRRAESEDETRFVFLALILLAVLSSFSSVVGLIGEARNAAGSIKAMYLGLAGFSIVSSWLIMQIVFTLHYAHDYYRPVPSTDEPARGLKFPEDERPDYWDFVYFTTSIGAASQTADVETTSKAMRRLVTCQAIVSFLFNTTVVALAINLAASLI